MENEENRLTLYNSVHGGIYRVEIVPVLSTGNKVLPDSTRDKRKRLNEDQRRGKTLRLSQSHLLDQIQCAVPAKPEG